MSVKKKKKETKEKGKLNFLQKSSFLSIKIYNFLNDNFRAILMETEKKKKKGKVNKKERKVGENKKKSTTKF